MLGPLWEVGGRRCPVQPGEQPLSHPQEDLSMPLTEEEIDGLSGLLFPFYDADTHMLYLAGKVVGDGTEDTPPLCSAAALPKKG